MPLTNYLNGKAMVIKYTQNPNIKNIHVILAS